MGQDATGAVAAQACHASTAALFTFAGDESVRLYTQPDALPTMHKVVLEVREARPPSDTPPLPPTLG